MRYLWDHVRQPHCKSESVASIGLSWDSGFQRHQSGSIRGIVHDVITLSSPSSGLIVASALIDISQQKPTDYKDKSQALKNRKALPPAHQGTCVWVSIHPLDPFLYHLRSDISSWRPLEATCVRFHSAATSQVKSAPFLWPFLSIRFTLQTSRSGQTIGNPSPIFGALFLHLLGVNLIPSACAVTTVKHAKLVELKVTLETENFCNCWLMGKGEVSSHCWTDFPHSVQSTTAGFEKWLVGVQSMLPMGVFSFFLLANMWYSMVLEHLVRMTSSALLSLCCGD